MNPLEMAYRKTAVEGASGFGLLISLYDTLAGDLRRAAEAERKGDIQKRCKEVNHAFLVIAFLQDRLEHGSDGELAEKLIRFYASHRLKLNAAQAKRSPEMLESEMEEVLRIREMWQDLEKQSLIEVEAAQVEAEAAPGEAAAWSAGNSYGSGSQEVATSSWSA